MGNNYLIVSSARLMKLFGQVVVELLIGAVGCSTSISYSSGFTFQVLARQRRDCGLSTSIPQPLNKRICANLCGSETPTDKENTAEICTL